MDIVKLYNGVEMPILGYGVYQVTPAECERCVADALSVGYRSIDTAQAYYNEEGVGNAVKKSGIAREDILERYGTHAMSWGPFAEGRNDFFMNSTLKTIGEKYGKSVAQTALRFLIQRGVIVIPKSTHKERMIENFNVFDFALTDEDMQEITGLDLRKSLFFSHNDPEMVQWLIGYK